MIEFIIHEKAGKGRASKARALIEARLDMLNIPYSFHQTVKKGHATFIAEQLCQHGATTIVAVGGDGTVHEVLNGLSNFESVRFGIIPTGTGNDFATALDIPEDPIKALDIIVADYTEHIDFYECGNVRGLNIVGTGIDVDILRHYGSKRMNNKAQYFFSLVHCLIHYKPYHLTIVESDGKKSKKDAFIACVCNGKQFGGGIKICPTASPIDGLLDVIIVNDIPKAQIPAAFIKLISGKIRIVKQTEYLRVKKITLEGNYNLQIDGEIYENHKFDVKVIPRTLRMFIPRKI